jgi:cell envelope opacity-associated protein A
MNIVELINKYGFPIVMAVGMGFIIKYVWEWATKEVKPVINDANTVLIALIDRIRMLDNDLIRLNQKVNTVLHLRGKMIESDRVMEMVKVEAQANKKFHDAMDEVDNIANNPINTKKKKSDPEDVKTARSGES